jgi:hypothetical protein
MSMRWRTQARCHHTTPPTIDDLLLQARSGVAWQTPSTRPASHGPRRRPYRPPDAPPDPRRAGKSVRIG